MPKPTTYAAMIAKGCIDDARPGEAEALARSFGL
jgi:hypothetical protein